MTTPLRSTLAVAAVVALFGCTSFAGIATLRGADAATPDLAPAEAKLYAGKRPGSGAPIARSFKEQPPLVPHAIDNFDEITVEENQCLECHSPEAAPKKKAPKVADSHLAAGNTVAMARYQCNTCHVPQVDAPPLVRSTFGTR
jgi:cytochrome c-type protein NapB